MTRTTTEPDGRTRPGAAGHPWLVAGLLAGLALAVFLPSVRCDFVNWDDPAIVSENRLVLGGLSLNGVYRACTEVVYHYWAPLTTLSYQLDVTLFGTQPWGFHLTNVVLHALSTGLLYVVLVRMTAAPAESAVATLLFALHPLRVESVTWISERKDVLGMLFLMLVLLAYEWTCRRPTIGRHLVVMAALAAGLMSKPTLVTLPVLLLLLDVWPLGRARLPGLDPPERAAGSAGSYPPRSWPDLIAEKLPLLLMALACVWITISASQHAIESDANMPLVRTRLPTGIQSLAFYVADTLLPVGLHPIHVHPGPTGWSPGLVAAGLGSSAALVGCGLAARRRLPAVTVGVAWFFVALSPMLGIVKQQGFQARADRFTYVPHIGLAVASAWAGAALAARLRLPRWLSAAIVGLVVATYVVLDLRQITVWHDSESLFGHTLAVEPTNAIAHEMCGIQAYLAKDYPAARSHFVAALGSRRSELFVTPRLAAVCFDMGDIAEARRLRQRALLQSRSRMTRWLVQHMRQGRAPEPPPAAAERLAAALAAVRAERPEEALAACREAIALAPDYAAAHAQAGLLLAALGRTEEAAAALRQAVTGNPLNADYRLHLARVLLQLGQTAAARVELDAALENDPTDQAILDLRLETEAPPPTAGASQ